MPKLPFMDYALEMLEAVKHHVYTEKQTLFEHQV